MGDFEDFVHYQRNVSDLPAVAAAGSAQAYRPVPASWMPVPGAPAAHPSTLQVHGAFPYAASPLAFPAAPVGAYTAHAPVASGVNMYHTPHPVAGLAVTFPTALVSAQGTQFLDQHTVHQQHLAPDYRQHVPATSLHVLSQTAEASFGSPALIASHDKKDARPKFTKEDFTKKSRVSDAMSQIDAFKVTVQKDLDLHRVSKPTPPPVASMPPAGPYGAPGAASTVTAHGYTGSAVQPQAYQQLQQLPLVASGSHSVTNYDSSWQQPVFGTVLPMHWSVAEPVGVAPVLQQPQLLASDNPSSQRYDHATIGSHQLAQVHALSAVTGGVANEVHPTSLHWADVAAGAAVAGAATTAGSAPALTAGLSGVGVGHQHLSNGFSIDASSRAAAFLPGTVIGHASQGTAPGGPTGELALNGADTSSTPSSRRPQVVAATIGPSLEAPDDFDDFMSYGATADAAGKSTSASADQSTAFSNMQTATVHRSPPGTSIRPPSVSSGSSESSHSPVTTPRHLVVPPSSGKSRSAQSRGAASLGQSKTKQEASMQKIGVIFKKYVDTAGPSLAPAEPRPYHNDSVGASNVGNQSEPAAAAGHWNGFVSAISAHHTVDLGSGATADTEFGDFQSLPVSTVTTDVPLPVRLMSDEDTVNITVKQQVGQHPMLLPHPTSASPGLVGPNRLSTVPVAATNVVGGVQALPGAGSQYSGEQRQAVVPQIGPTVGQTEDTFDDFIAFQSFVQPVDISAQYENSATAVAQDPHNKPGPITDAAAAAADAAAADAAAAVLAAAHPKQSSKAADWSRLSDLNEFSTTTDFTADGSLFAPESHVLKDSATLAGGTAAITSTVGHTATKAGDAADDGFADFAAFQQDASATGQSESAWHAASLATVPTGVLTDLAYDDDWGSFLGPADSNSRSSITVNTSSSFGKRSAVDDDQVSQNDIHSLSPPSMVAMPVRMKGSNEGVFMHDTSRAPIALDGELAAVPGPVHVLPMHEVTSLVRGNATTVSALATAAKSAEDVECIDDRYDYLRPPSVDDYELGHDDGMGPPPMGPDAYDHDDYDIAFGSFTSFSDTVKAATVHDQHGELLRGKGSGTGGAKHGINGSLHVATGSGATAIAAFSQDKAAAEVRPAIPCEEESMPDTGILHVRAGAEGVAEPALAASESSPAAVAAAAELLLAASADSFDGSARSAMPKGSLPGAGATLGLDDQERFDIGPPLPPAAVVVHAPSPIRDLDSVHSSSADFAPFSAFPADENVRISDSSTVTGVTSRPDAGCSRANAVAFAAFAADVDVRGCDDGDSGSWGFASSPPPLPASGGPCSDDDGTEEDVGGWGFTRTAARDDVASPVIAEHDSDGWEEFHTVVPSRQSVLGHSIDKDSSSGSDVDMHRSVYASAVRTMAGRNDSWEDLHAVAPTTASDHVLGLPGATVDGDPALAVTLDAGSSASVWGQEPASAGGAHDDWFSTRSDGGSAADWAGDWTLPNAVPATVISERHEQPATPALPVASAASVPQPRDSERPLADPGDDESWAFGTAHPPSDGQCQMQPPAAKAYDIPDVDHGDEDDDWTFGAVAPKAESDLPLPAVDEEDDNWTFGAVAPKVESDLPPPAVDDDWAFQSSSDSSLAAMAISTAGSVAAAAATITASAAKESSAVIPQAATLKILQIAFAASAAIQWASLAGAAAGLPRPINSLLSGCRLWTRLCDLDSSPAMMDMVWSSSACCSRMLSTLPLSDLSSVPAGPHSRAVSGHSPLGAESSKERRGGGLLMPVMLAPTRTPGGSGSSGGSSHSSGGSNHSSGGSSSSSGGSSSSSGGSSSGGSSSGGSSRSGGSIASGSRSGGAPSLSAVLPSWEQPSSSAEVVSAASLDSDWMFAAPVGTDITTDAGGAASSIPVVPFDLDFLESVTSSASSKPPAPSAAEQSSAQSSTLPAGSFDLSFFEALSATSSRAPGAKINKAGPKKKS